ncbi:hypothetical protein GS532_16670 [Rhodococcus hoagii]|nr:hypothetical protein [Prescottella equi]
MALSNPQLREDIAIFIKGKGSWISFHTTDPGTNGGNEASGGGYARKQTTWTDGAVDGIVTGAAVEIYVLPARGVVRDLVGTDRRYLGREVPGQLHHPVGGRNNPRHPHPRPRLLMAERIAIVAPEGWFYACLHPNRLPPASRLRSRWLR